MRLDLLIHTCDVIWIDDMHRYSDILFLGKLCRFRIYIFSAVVS